MGCASRRAPSSHTNCPSRTRRDSSCRSGRAGVEHARDGGRRVRRDPVLEDLARARRARARRHMLSLTASGTPASGRRSPAATRASTLGRMLARQIGAAPSDRRRCGRRPRRLVASAASVISRAESFPALTSRAISAALRSTDVAHPGFLLGDDPRNAKEIALPLRRLREHDFAVRHGAGTSSRCTLRDSTTCAVAATALASSLESASTCISRSPSCAPKRFDLFVGERDAREFCDVANVDGIGRQRLSLNRMT